MAKEEGWKTLEFKTQTTHTRTADRHADNFHKTKSVMSALREVKESMNPHKNPHLLQLG